MRSCAPPRGDGQVALAVPRDEQGWSGWPALLDLGEERQAVHPGHLDVADDDVVVRFLDAPKRLLGGVARVDLDVLHAQAQRLGKRFEQRGVVVHHEYERAAHRAGSMLS